MDGVFFLISEVLHVKDVESLQRVILLTDAERAGNFIPDLYIFT